MISYFKNKRLALLLIILLATFLRLLFLSSDPSILYDSGQIGDEGYWIYNARSLVLFNKLSPDKFYHDIAAAPLFSLFTLLNFSIFGVGLWQARLISAIAGTITVFITYKIGLGINKRVALLASFLVATNILLILHNRLAVGESLSYMFVTLSFYFLIVKKSLNLGLLSLILAIFSKTTSFLYIPPFILVLSNQYPNISKVIYKNSQKITPIFLLTIFISLLLILFFGGEIIKIYQTFGSWYAPTNLNEVAQNIIRFFLHPFWGSPFIFVLVSFSFINSLASFSLGNISQLKKSLIYWILGFLFLGSLMSRLTHVRFLGLIVPISILASEIILNPKLFKIQISNIESFFITNKRIFNLVIFLLTIVFSMGSAKIILAAIKRLTFNENIVNNLYFLTILFIPCYFLIFKFYKKILTPYLIRFGIILIIFAPIISLFLSINDLTNVFLNLNKSSLFNLLILITFLVFIFYAQLSKLNFKGLLYILVPIHIIFTFLAFLTIYLYPSYNLQSASKKLGQIAKENAVIGFYAHELSIENQIKPIYWAPRLNNIESVNSDYQKYNPQILLVNQIFDNKKEEVTPWPNPNDLNKKVNYIDTLDLTRAFAGLKREFKINIYEIVN